MELDYSVAESGWITAFEFEVQYTREERISQSPLIVIMDPAEDCMD